MANNKSAGVYTRTIEVIGPTGIKPFGTPAGVIGTAQKGPAYVPTTVATAQDFIVTFGAPTNHSYNGPLATTEWLRNQQAATYLRVLGVGKGNKRETSGANTGRVDGAGFIVGAQQPQSSLSGALSSNAYANVNGVPGRTHFLITVMSESAGSSVFRDAGKPGAGTPIVRAVLMTASGVLARLSNTYLTGSSTNTPSASDVAGTNYRGDVVGTVNLSGSRQEFVMLLNGHKGTDSQYPNVITASFDPDMPNYFGNVFNKNPLKMEQAGYYLYAEYAIHPSLAVITGTNVVKAGAVTTTGLEPVAFMITGSAAYNTGSTTAPNYENFENRYTTPKTTWFTSQKFGGRPVNLFRIHSLDDGAWANQKTKITIENITPGTDASPYGSFDIIVRAWDDTDKDRVILEAFRGLNLNKSSTKYIARAIGDIHNFYNWDASQGNQKLITEGDSANVSKYIRVEMGSSVDAEEIDPSALPFGFRGLPHIVTSGSAPLANTYVSASTFFSTTTIIRDSIQPPVPFRENLTLGSTNKVVDKSLTWGVQFNQKRSVTEPNGSVVADPTLPSLTNYFPDFQTDQADFIVYDNEGTADTTTMGILDADRFNNNGFSLSNVKITYTPNSGDTSNGTPNIQTMVSWSYVRTGGVAADGVTYRELRTTDLSDPAVRQVAKFTTYLQGGFDGVRIFNTDTADMTNKSVIEEMNNSSRGITNGPTVVAYTKAVDVISDITETDIQLLTIPGIRETIITDYALQTIENRFDAFYIMDIDAYDTNNNVITSYDDQIASVRYTTTNFRNRGLNSSFGAAYFPDVVLRDGFSGTKRTVAASVATLGAFGKNDAVGYPWFAPAGFTRGALDTTEEAVIKVNKQNLDDLQEVGINPIVAFPGSEGNVIWGQRTLLATESSLERVNVRRLLIELRRRVRKIANRVVFEQGRPETLARFESLVRPILKQVQDQKGVDSFLVKIDTTTTTEADIENKTIRGKIFVAPTKTLEFLDIDFVLTNNANFATNG